MLQDLCIVALTAIILNGCASIQVADINFKFYRNQPEDVSLTWDVVPSSDLSHIRDFVVYYSTASGSNHWYFVRSQRNSPTVTLKNLKPETTYFVKIQAIFFDGRQEETNEWSFTTLPAPSVSGIQIQPLVDGNGLKLKWELDPRVNRNNIEGFRILTSRYEHLPEEQWDSLYVRGSNADEAQLGNLGEGKSFIRIIPRTFEGKELHAPVFSFETTRVTQTQLSDFRVSYQMVGDVTLRLFWNEPSNLRGRIIQYTVEYTQNADAGWHRQVITDPEQRRVDITMHRGSPMYVKIMPGTAEQAEIDNGILLTVQADRRRRRSKPLPASNDCTSDSPGQATGCKKGEK